MNKSGLGQGFNFGIGLAIAGIFLVLCLCGACFVGVIGLGVISETAAVPTPRVTRLDTGSNNEPVVEQPSQPAPTGITINFEEIKRNGKDAGWTDVQFDEYKKSIKGLRAENWQGNVVDVKQAISSDYYIEIDMPGTKDEVDVFLYIPKDKAMALQKGQAVTFSGVIDGLYPNLLGDYQVEVRDGIVK